ncbi:Dps family protein [Acholeplasma granularum]|uniref:Dps family protein n=1 Tax=Acholeplasma granularum TaxID=264635 RepID=UPI00046EA927|nr:DNA starvation/stationary phase protection protein [Acholeplasma granularum]
MNNQLHQGLNKEVANLFVLFTKLHHFHWFVEGNQFFILHEKFEELYDEVNELYDQFAERLITIGGKPASKLSDYLKLTTLKETDNLDSNKMVGELLQDLKQLVKEFKELTSVSQELGDEQTADLLISTVSSFEKHIWMFTAFNK